MGEGGGVGSRSRGLVRDPIGYASLGSDITFDGLWRVVVFSHPGKDTIGADAGSGNGNERGLGIAPAFIGAEQKPARELAA
jgi:hypothetical protein